MTKPIATIWHYYDAPEHLQQSTNGGDEDWLVYADPEMADHLHVDLPWIRALGCFHVDEIKQSDGSVIYIGSHA